MFNRFTLMVLTITSSAFPGYPQDIRLDHGMIDTPGETYGEMAYAIYVDGEFREYVEAASDSEAMPKALQRFPELMVFLEAQAEESEEE